MNTIGDRLKHFIEKTYVSQNKFCEKIGVNKDIISRYIQNKTLPGTEILLKMIFAGLSIDWLLSGSGKIFSNSEIGRKLFANEINSSTSYDKPFDRIKSWIVDNYTSVENFSLQHNLEFGYLMEILDENSILDPKLIRLLSDVGCNLDWIIYKTGCSVELTRPEKRNVNKFKIIKFQNELLINPKAQVTGEIIPEK